MKKDRKEIMKEIEENLKDMESLLLLDNNIYNKKVTVYLTSCSIYRPVKNLIKIYKKNKSQNENEKNELLERCMKYKKVIELFLHEKIFLPAYFLDDFRAIKELY